jgi:hypothetical protein
LPGLIAYLAIHINLTVMLATVLRQAPCGESRLLAMGLAGALTAILVHGLLDAPLWGTKLAFLPWLVFALVVLLYCQVMEVRRSEARTALSPPVSSCDDVYLKTS